MNSRGPVVVAVVAAGCLALAAAAIARSPGPNAPGQTVVAAAGTTTTAAAVAPSTTVVTTLAPTTTVAPVTTAAPPRSTTAVTRPAPTVASATVVSATNAATTSGLSALAGKTIAVDPGHNGMNYAHPEINQPVNIGNGTRACDTTGTETNGGYTEAAYTLDVSLRLAAILRGAGANVVMTRTTNDGFGPCINQRAAIGNQAHAAAAISIHADGGPAEGHGFHVLYPVSIPGLTAPIAGPSLRLAGDVRDAYHAGTGMPYATYVGNGDGLMARSDLGGLNLSTVPKVFIETGNMRNASDAALLTDPTFRQRAAAAIAAGLARFLSGQ
jgi:N-acetylmuramoyl-L-alanine amidase